LALPTARVVVRTVARSPVLPWAWRFRESAFAQSVAVPTTETAPVPNAWIVSPALV